MYARSSGPNLDGGVTRSRLVTHQQLRPLAPEIYSLSARRALQSQAIEPVSKPLSIFLSYASEHCDAALKIYSFLQGVGHRVWMDVYDLPPHRDLAETIANAIDSHPYFLACLSAACVEQARFVFRELAQALAKMRGSPYLYVVPIIVAPFPLPDDLRELSPLDFALDGALAQLAHMLKLGSEDRL